MLKKIYGKGLLLSFFCAMLFLCSCQKGKDEPKQSGGLSQKVDEQGLTEKQRETALELKGKVFGEMPAVGTEDPVYCNFPENTTAWENHLPICYDPLYGILYYVDYNGDSMIHAVKDGEEEIAVRIPGKRLFCRKGKLYFLLDAGTSFAVEGAKNGNILSYDPVTGEITVLSDGIFDSIFVYQDLIYCRRIIEEYSYGTNFNYCFYFFDTEELFVQEEQSPISYRLEGMRYGDYFVAGVFGPYDRSNPDSLAEELIQSGEYRPEDFQVLTGWELRRWDGSGSIPLEGIDFNGKSYYIKGDNIFWLDADGVHTWNIPAQQGQVTAVERKVTDSYSLIGGQVYAMGGTNRIDIKSGVSQLCLSMLPDKFAPHFKEFYTDGERTYGIAYDLETLMERLYCIEWCSMEEARSILSENKEMLSALESILRSASGEAGEPYEGILRLVPINTYFKKGS